MTRRPLARRLLALMWLTLVLVLGTDPAHGQTAQDIAAKAFRSTVLLVMEDANGHPVSLGSGFFVRRGEIVTNLHVVEGAAKGYAKVVGEKQKHDIEGIAAVEPERDLVLLKVSAGRSQELPLGNSDAVQVGEPVFAVGNPQGLEGTFSQGIVSSIRTVGPDTLIQITAPISPGSSGGPVLNSKGQVIGVSVATFKGGQNLNFAIPSNYLKPLLAKVGPAKPLANEASRGKQRSIMADLGGRSTEGVVGGHFVWTHPLCQSGACGDYTFSLRNQLRADVRNVSYLVVFYDEQGNPVEVSALRYPGVIPAGLAKRMAGSVDGSVTKLATTPPDPPSTRPRPRDGRAIWSALGTATRVVIMILDFQMMD